MFRTPDASRKILLTLALAGLALAVAAAASAQTRRARQAAKPKPTPTPVVVPRRPPAQPAGATPTPTPDIINVPTSQDDAPPPPPPPTPTPTPRPTPKPKPVEESLDETDVVRVTSNLVVVPVAVTDAAGNAVQGLRKEDFQLEEEGRAQELQAVGDAEQVPLDIVILFDISSSVTAKDFFARQQEAAARFLRLVMKPSDRAAVVTIADKPALVQPLAPSETAAATMLKIPAATRATPTAFYDSVSFAAKYLGENAPGSHRRVILAVTDGDDNFSTAVREQTVAEYEAQRKAEAQEASRPVGERAAARRDLQSRHQRAVQGVQRAVQGADAVFYSINPGGPSVRLNEISTRAQTGMQTVADSTGGTAYVPARNEELDAIFRQVAAELRAQYLLQYLSNNQAAAGKFLRIKVSAPAQKATGTAFYDTVTEAARYLAKNAPERNRRVILVISDGEDNFSNDVRDVMLSEGKQGHTQAEATEHQKGLHAKAAQKVLREVQRADAVFYSINPGGPSVRLNEISMRAQTGMQTVADATGGTAYVPGRNEELDAIFRQVAAELRAQYLLQYLSNNQAATGKFLRIKVATPSRPDLRIRARQGYFKKG